MLFICHYRDTIHSTVEILFAFDGIECTVFCEDREFQAVGAEGFEAEFITVIEFFDDAPTLTVDDFLPFQRIVSGSCQCDGVVDFRKVFRGIGEFAQIGVRRTAFRDAGT